MARGRPMFRPQPEWIIGTMARTMMAFQLKRLNTLVNWVHRLTWAKGASRNISSRNAVMISLGTP